MMSVKPLCLLLLCAILSACSKKQAPAAAPPAAIAAPVAAAKAAPTPTAEQQLRAELMAAVFGKQYRAASGDALTELPWVEDRGTLYWMVVTPVAHAVQPDGSTVLVANAQMADDKGEGMVGHSSPGLLNVYVLKRDGGRWRVLKRHDSVDALGSYSHFDEVLWLDLAPGKPGLGVKHGDTSQGYSMEALSLFDLGADTLRNLTDGISLRSDSEGACGPHVETCWDVSGAWRFVPGAAGAPYQDLVIDFSGHTDVATDPVDDKRPDDSVTRLVTPVKARARYAFDGKIYRLVEGENVVPGY